jgi:hypothetical protein
VENIDDALDAIKAGRFADVLTEIDKIESLWSGDPDDLKKAKVKKQVEQQLEAWKTRTITTIRKAFLSVRDALHLRTDFAALLEDQLEIVIAKIQGVSVEDLNELDKVAQDLRQSVFGPIQNALENPAWAKRWLDLQTDNFLEGGRAQVEQALKDNVLTTLRDLGFPTSLVDTFEAEIKDTLDHAQRLAGLQARTYTESVKNLLLAVEERRQEMQSPARKVWRNLRCNETLTVAAVVVFLVIGALGIVLAVSPGWPEWWWRWLVAAIFLVLGLFVAVIVQRSFKDTRKFSDLILAIEKRYNSLKGETQPPAKYGDIQEKVAQRIENMGPTSVGQVLLQQDDLHRDQETSRLRWIRVLSLVVGLLLAYRLSIDAAVYLNYAIPGIEEQINSLVNFAVWEERYAWFPEDLTVGILLTGLAAAAGSKFWRDLLGRLQATRAQSEEAARLVRKVKGMVEPENQ